MKKPRISVLLLVLLLAATGVQSQFFSEMPEYQNLAREEFVDVYYEFAELTPEWEGDAGGRSKVTRGNWNVAESARRRIICESGNYKVVSSLEHPSVEEFILGENNLLGKSGIIILAEDSEGVTYESSL